MIARWIRSAAAGLYSVSQEQLRERTVLEIWHDALLDPAPRNADQLREQPRPARVLVVLEVVVQRPLGDCEGDGLEAVFGEVELDRRDLANDRIELGLRRDVLGREREDR